MPYAPHTNGQEMADIASVGFEDGVQLIRVQVDRLTPIQTVKEIYETIREHLSKDIKLVVSFSNVSLLPGNEGSSKLLASPEQSRIQERWLKATHAPIWYQVMSDQVRECTKHYLVNFPLAINLKQPDKTYRSVAFGGSLDGCHDGHCLVLFRCFQLLQSQGHSLLLLGLMPDSSVQNKDECARLMAYGYSTREYMLRLCVRGFAEDLGYRSCEIRDTQTSAASRVINVTSVMEFAREGSTIRVEISELDVEGVGVAGVDERLECLVLSQETLKGGAVVNERRRQLGLKPLEIEICPLVLRSTCTGKISSKEERLQILNKRNDTKRLLQVIAEETANPSAASEGRSVTNELRKELARSVLVYFVREDGSIDSRIKSRITKEKLVRLHETCTSHLDVADLDVADLGGADLGGADVDDVNLH